MTRGSWILSGIVCAALAASAANAADLSSYRGFQFGAKLSAVAQQAGMKPTEARLVHQRPAMIQELNFQPNLYRNSASVADPVSEIQLSFYNAELYRMVVLYDRYKVAGMMPQDMVEAISATYGTATKPATEVAYHSYSSENAAVIARWEDSQYSYNLVRAEDRSSFALVLYSKDRDPLAQAAIAESVRLDAEEAPQREAARAKKLEDDSRVQQEKSRMENKANFRP